MVNIYKLYFIVHNNQRKKYNNNLVKIKKMYKVKIKYIRKEQKILLEKYQINNLVIKE